MGRKKIIIAAVCCAALVAVVTFAFRQKLFLAVRKVQITSQNTQSIDTLPPVEVTDNEGNGADTKTTDAPACQGSSDASAENGDVCTLPPSTTNDGAQKTVTADIAKSADATTPSTDTQAPATGVVNKMVSWGFQKSSERTIKAIIIHTSYNAIGGDVFDFSKVMQEWKDAGVSPHYAIDRKGTIYQLVADQNIAWHAGSSKLPDGTTDVNGASIGIEVVNDQDSKFTDAQYDALNSLIASLKKKHPIKYVLGHDDIAPGRKTDPWGIEWGKVQK